ncbi:metallopeptidase TldD-related protein [candidate division KSB1 bacterium]
MNKIITYIIVVILITLKTGIAQNNVFIEAMKQEIQRGMDSLKIEEMLSPSFISYSISDANSLQIKAILGAIVLSQERPIRKFENRVLVGENGKTNENYLDENNMWSWNRLSNNIPFSNDKDDIRRALWLLTDNNYKNAITNYEAKISALSQQSLTEEEKQMLDFCSVSKSEIVIPYQSVKINKTEMESIARNLSSVFKKHPLIQKSDVNIFVYDGQVYFANSEGTSVQYPFQITSVKVVATTQAPSGEILNDHVLWFCKNASQLPDEKTMLAEVERMAKNISELTQKSAVTEPYCGPILFEGQAAAEVFIQKFFTNINGLITVRKPVVGSPQILSMSPDKVKENMLEAMINKKIISRDLTVEALPTLTDFQNTSLVGSFIADAEGVKANDNLILVENGVLKNLLCGRIPTLKMNQSNGHSRVGLNNGGVKTVTGPGVIKMTNNNPETSVEMKKLKEKLIEAAKEEDLEYAYIVRKVVSDAAGIEKEGNISFFGASKPKIDLSKTIQVYRVNVSDGSEELVILAEVQGLSVKSFKRLLASSKEMQVYNTMVQPISGDLRNWEYKLSGIPASFILPEGLLFQELDIVKEKQGMVKNIPVVGNPLSNK